jgi:hypothetical protein
VLAAARSCAMSPTAPQQWQHTTLSLVNFVAFLSNFLVAFAPLPQAITVHKVPRPQLTIWSAL